MAVGTAEHGPIRVFLLDDDSVARATLRAALAEYGDIEVVGDTSSGGPLLDQSVAEAADVVILDCPPPSEDMVELCRSLKAYRASLGVLLLSAMERPPLRLAIEIADGLILKATPVAELVQGIRNVHRGKPALDRRLWPALFGDDMER